MLSASGFTVSRSLCQSVAARISRLQGSQCIGGCLCRGRERADELEAAWWQEHAELALGPSAAAGTAGPSGGSPTKGGGDDKMTQKVVHVAAKKQQLLDREVTATSWRVRICWSHTASDKASLVALDQWFDP